MATKKKTRKVTKKIVKRAKVKTKAKKSPRVAKRKMPLRDSPSAVATGGNITKEDIKKLQGTKNPFEGAKVEPNPNAPEKHKSNPKFPVWENAKCGACGHDASNDPNGEKYLYKLQCPSCDKEGCDGCMPAGRGCECPECEESDSGDEVVKVDEDPEVDEDVEEEPNG